MGSNNIPPFNMKPMLIMVVLTIMFLALASLANANHVGIVWGQGGEAEGTLEAACTSGSPANYSVVKIAFLTHFGSGESPALYLPGHCPEPYEVCDLTSAIRACQNRGIKVLLSLGWNTGDPEEFFPTSQSATVFADYLWTHFLAGPDYPGPLGRAILDGIDIEIGRGTNDNFVAFVDALAQHLAGRRLYLSATPNCTYPDAFLEGVINTGLMDFVFVKFYNDSSCEFDHNAHTTNLLAAWEQWNGVRAGEVRLQLVAQEGKDTSGFIPTTPLQNDVIREVKQWPLYGGFMLWNRLYDIESGYSASIVDADGVSRAIA